MENFKRICYSFLKQLLIIFLYLGTSITLQLTFKDYILNKNVYLSTFANLWVELIILTIFILIFRKYLIPDFDDFKINSKKYIKKYYKYWLIGLAVMMVSNVIISFFHTMSTNEELNREYLFELPFYSIIATTIFAPIIEEAMTRILFKDTFKNNMIYYTLSGLIFGGLHLLSATSLIEILYIIPYGALGFAFAYIYKHSNNIWTNIFFHFLHNLIAITIIFLGV